MKVHKLLFNWLRGTTCYYKAKCRIVAENERYILFKHNAHSEYINRMSGSKCCNAYYVLYNVNTKLEDLKTDIKSIRKWYGRNTDKKIIEYCQILGIEFDLNYQSPFEEEQEEREESKQNTTFLEAKNLTSFDGLKL